MKVVHKKGLVKKWRETGLLVNTPKEEHLCLAKALDLQAKVMLSVYKGMAFDEDEPPGFGYSLVIAAHCFNKKKEKFLNIPPHTFIRLVENHFIIQMEKHPFNPDNYYGGGAYMNYESEIGSLYWENF